MLFLLSPAKSLDYDTEVPEKVPATRPHFESPRGPSVELIKILREKSPQQIAELMHLSDKLAALNVARYAAWASKGTERNARQAALAFDGDVYGGLDARTLSTAQMAWAQDHVCILSGLYGLLRPLDLLQPYRLEMGTQLANRHGKDLYAFWGPRIAEHLNDRLAADRTPVVINLASQEYFKSVDQSVLKARVVECVFQEWKGGAGAKGDAGSYKIVSFFAKRARGLMARWAVLHKAATPKALEKFDLEGYRFDAGASKPERLVFRRRSA
ncbi:peroxide stress protein YaaA [Variovorax sp. GT1P44]|uniref:peroxide stress protein YaaA n=1 Tax=Variovorax sp. GT1P44 TaxID=3443742 RepID=UPI003F47CBEF